MQSVKGGKISLAPSFEIPSLFLPDGRLRRFRDVQIDRRSFANNSGDPFDFLIRSISRLTAESRSPNGRNNQRAVVFLRIDQVWFISSRKTTHDKVSCSMLIFIVATIDVWVANSRLEIKCDRIFRKFTANARALSVNKALFR